MESMQKRIQSKQRKFPGPHKFVVYMYVVCVNFSVNLKKINSFNNIRLQATLLIGKDYFFVCILKTLKLNY